MLAVTGLTTRDIPSESTTSCLVSVVRLAVFWWLKARDRMLLILKCFLPSEGYKICLSHGCFSVWWCEIKLLAESRKRHWKLQYLALPLKQCALNLVWTKATKVTGCFMNDVYPIHDTESLLNCSIMKITISSTTVTRLEPVTSSQDWTPPEVMRIQSNTICFGKVGRLRRSWGERGDGKQEVGWSKLFLISNLTLTLLS